MPAVGQTLRKIVAQNQKELLTDWVQAQLAATTLRADLMKEVELREQSRELLSLVQVTDLLDKLGLFTTETYVKGREDITRSP